jgi:hypothetical protein
MSSITLHVFRMVIKDAFSGYKERYKGHDRAIKCSCACYSSKNEGRLIVMASWNKPGNKRERRPGERRRIVPREDGGQFTWMALLCLVIIIFTICALFWIDENHGGK